MDFSQNRFLSKRQEKAFCLQINIERVDLGGVAFKYNPH